MRYGSFKDNITRVATCYLRLRGKRLLALRTHSTEGLRASWCQCRLYDDTGKKYCTRVLSLIDQKLWGKCTCVCIRVGAQLQLLIELCLILGKYDVCTVTISSSRKKFLKIISSPFHSSTKRGEIARGLIWGKGVHGGTMHVVLFVGRRPSGGKGAQVCHSFANCLNKTFMAIFLRIFWGMFKWFSRK